MQARRMDVSLSADILVHSHVHFQIFWLVLSHFLYYLLDYRQR